jgi:outer membrane protein TolC
MRRVAGLLFGLLLAAPAGWAQQQQQTPLRLTMRDAIDRALRFNLSVRVAGTRVEEAAGARERRLAALLPHVSAGALASLQNRNLKAFGFSFSLPGVQIPTVVGPFSNYDFRVFADQTLIDRQATHLLRSSEQQQQAARLDDQDARDLVVRQAAGLYLDAQSTQAEVQAAESRLATSQALFKLAQDQHATGLATGIDVLRANVQLQRDQQSLLVARDASETAILVLERFIGTNPGTPVELADRLEFRRVEIPEVGHALHGALQERSDYRSLLAQRQSLIEQQKASRARYLPKLAVSGNYGALGRGFGEMPGTGLIEASVSVTLFDRDRKGESEELDSRLRSVSEQIADLERGITQELRKAILDLQSAAQQVQVTQSGLDLAHSELALAQDRFRNGLTDNIEVVTAQASLEAAQDSHILALARHADAATALARALGATERIYPQYLGGP